MNWRVSRAYRRSHWASAKSDSMNWLCVTGLRLHQFGTVQRRRRDKTNGRKSEKTNSRPLPSAESSATDLYSRKVSSVTETSSQQANVKKWFYLHELVWNHPFETENHVSAEKQKLTMLALVKFANGDGKSCHPGQTRLAVMAGQSTRSVKRCLRLFEDKGFVDSKRRRHTSNAYTINQNRIREATVMAYLPIAFVLARNGRLTPALSGHIESVLRPFDAASEAISDTQSGHSHDLQTTSNDLPDIEQPNIDQSDPLDDRITIATEEINRDSFANAQLPAHTSEPREEETDFFDRVDPDYRVDGADQEDLAPDDVASDPYSDFFNRADGIALSLSQEGASPDVIMSQLDLLLAGCEQNVRERIERRKLRSVAEWAVKLKGCAKLPDHSKVGVTGGKF